jgi:hypothetical protein
MNRNLLIGMGLGGLVLMTVIATRKTEDSLRQAMVDAAVKEQQNPDPQKYCNDTIANGKSVDCSKLSWCGIFALYCLHVAGLGLDIGWILGKGFLYRLPNLFKTKPKMGDIAYFDRYQHHAIVKSVNSDGTVTLINGNGAPGQITTTTKKLSDVTAFFSIAPLIKKVL